MAKLNKKFAKQAADEADNWVGTGVLPAGLYLCKLREVDSSKSGAAGPYWVWEYESVEAGEQPVGRRFWDNTSLSEKAIGRLGKTFQAFDATTDTDTDDLIGRLVCLDIKQGTIQKGDKAGEKRNEIVAVLPASAFPDYEEVEAATGKQKAGSTASADDF